MTTTWPTPASGTLTGPWSQAFYFTLATRVRSKSNYRADSRSRHEWADLKAFANLVALSARSARPAGWEHGSVGTPISSRPRILAAFYSRTMLDAGNLDKSILDAVQAPARPRGLPAHHPGAPGIVMADDAQVAGVAAWTTRTRQNEGLVAAFARVPSTSSDNACATALASLITAVNALLEDDS